MSAAMVESTGRAGSGVPTPTVEMRLSGALTVSTAGKLRAAFNECASGGGLRLTVDMQRVTAIDAAGIAALLDGRRAIESRAGAAMTLRVNRVVRQALRASGTITAFHVRDGQAM